MSKVTSHHKKYIVRSIVLQKGEWKESTSTYNSFQLAEHSAKEIACNFDSGTNYFDMGKITSWAVTMSKALIEEEEMCRWGSDFKEELSDAD